MSTVATREYTPEDLLRMPDGDRYELVDGQLVEQNMSAWSSYVAGRLHRRLANHCEEHRLGWALPEGTTYQCFPDAPKKVRKADTSYFRPERLSLEMATEEGHLSLAPDLAVEVVSPNDTVYELDKKTEEYLSAGVEIVWVVHPLNRTVQILRKDGTVAMRNENEDLDGENVVPGFRCRIADLFVPPAGVSAT